MAEVKKNNRYRIPKGTTPNPNGRPKMSPEEKGIREMNRYVIQQELRALSGLTKPEITQIAKGEHPFYQSANSVIVASVMKKSWEDGRFSDYNQILDRTIGKVKEEIEHSGAMNLSSATDAELEKIAREYFARKQITNG